MSVTPSGPRPHAACAMKNEEAEAGERQERLGGTAGE